MATRNQVNVYMGWDSREVVAYKVCEYSIRRKTRMNPNIQPLVHRDLRKSGYFKRPWLVEAGSGDWIDLIDGKPFSTEFSHTRFLVPALQKYKGWALFMDCDMIFTDDIKKLFDLADDKYAVMVVKHKHEPKESIKMDDRLQTRYRRKNWSSFILWNCNHPANKALTPEVVNKADGTWLHQFSWLEDNQIGTLPFEYNWIENVSPVVNKPHVIHYTLGGPWFQNEKCQNVKYAQEWVQEYERWQREGDHEVTDVPSTKWG
jgi:lipopolysaccharide biosynthesis glycosyltransferase